MTTVAVFRLSLEEKTDVIASYVNTELLNTHMFYGCIFNTK